MIHLVTGGARSGKSRWAQAEVEAEAGPLWFVATAEARDDDMAARIRRHQEDRGPRWRLCEEPLELPERLGVLAGPMLVDCLTLWVSNLLFSPRGEDDGWLVARQEALVDALVARPDPTWLVTNEVGLGIVPADPLTRRYRDELGRLNQRVARCADRVTLLVAGLPLRVK